MNINTKVWAYTSASSVASELVQRLAFSFGYKWGNGNNSPQYTEDIYLFFDPECKLITYGNNGDTVERVACKLVSTLTEALELFNNPPEPIRKFENDVFIAYSNGMVVFKQTGFHVPAVTMDKIIHERRKIYVPR